MSAPSPTGTAAVLFARELGRRWPTLLFMLFMPLAYFAISYLTSDPTARVPVPVPVGDGDARVVPEVLDRDLKSVYLAVLGISVTSSFATLTALLGSHEAMRRLRVAGYRPRHLLAARLAVLALVTVVSTLVFSVAFIALTDVAAVWPTVVSLLAVGLLGMGVGAVIGLLLNRQFEAAMLVVALSGLEMALGRGDSDAERYLVYWPAVEALKRSTFTGGAVGPLLAQAAGYLAVLLIVAGLVWSRRTRIWRSPAPARSDGPD